MASEVTMTSALMKAARSISEQAEEIYRLAQTAHPEANVLLASSRDEARRLLKRTLEAMFDLSGELRNCAEALGWRYQPTGEDSETFRGELTVQQLGLAMELQRRIKSIRDELEAWAMLCTGLAPQLSISTLLDDGNLYSPLSLAFHEIDHLAHITSAGRVGRSITGVSWWFWYRAQMVEPVDHVLDACTSKQAVDVRATERAVSKKDPDLIDAINRAASVSHISDEEFEARAGMRRETIASRAEAVLTSLLEAGWRP